MLFVQTDSEMYEVITMSKFKLSVQWIMTSEVEVEADTLEQAVQQELHNPELPSGEYLADSYQVNDEMTRVLNKWDEPQKAES